MPLLRALALITLLACPGVAQTGRVFDDLSMESDILRETRKYAVYLPPDYDTSQRSYPVLYLLHGKTDDQAGWIQYGEVLRIADQAIRDGQATPMVIVMPNADQTHQGYTNHISEDFRYEDFFFEELMPHVESQYRIRKRKRFRAVAGLSMGGNGSYIYALHRPDLFSSACPLSAYAGPLSKREIREGLRKAGAEATAAQINEHYHRYSILRLVKEMPDQQRYAVRWYIDCGDDDFLYEGNSRVHIAMKKRGVPHEYRVRDGGHTWTYWRTALPEVLEFVSDGFRQK